MRLTHGSLFAGIGGFDLGFERAGFETIWQVEIDPFCRKVLAKHFPGAERFEDVRTVGKHNLARVDVVSGGFPCQDESLMGRQAGLDGERSGLWFEMRRIVREIRPQIVVVENVAALLGRDIGRVLADLAEIGYDAEWDVLPACAFGAPHQRERVFVVGYSVREGLEGLTGDVGNRTGGASPSRPISETSLRSGAQEDVADTEVIAVGTGLCASKSSEVGRGRFSDGGSTGHTWAVEPDVGRVAHGVPARVDRLKGLGNAVVPQIAEWIAQKIKAVMEQKP